MSDQQIIALCGSIIGILLTVIGFFLVKLHGKLEGACKAVHVLELDLATVKGDAKTDRERLNGEQELRRRGEDEFARVRDSAATKELLNERSDAQDGMIVSILKKVSGLERTTLDLEQRKESKGQFPATRIERVDPDSDPPIPPMRARMPSRRG